MKLKYGKSKVTLKLGDKTYEASPEAFTIFRHWYLEHTDKGVAPGLAAVVLAGGDMAFFATRLEGKERIEAFGLLKDVCHQVTLNKRLHMPMLVSLSAEPEKSVDSETESASASDMSQDQSSLSKLGELNKEADSKILGYITGMTPTPENAYIVGKGSKDGSTIAARDLPKSSPQTK
jgi:hypothetical protein